LAMAEADPALPVTDHDQRREAKTLAALHCLRDAVDMHELFDQLVATVVVTLPAAATAIVPTPAATTAAFSAAAASTATALPLRSGIAGSRGPTLGSSRCRNLGRSG